MTPALFHVLARSLNLGVRGLSRPTQLALTFTSASWKRCLLNRIAVKEMRGVRYCSGSNTFRPKTFITRQEEEDPEKDIMAPHSVSNTHNTDLSSIAMSEDFLLPSQQKQFHKDLLVAKIERCESTSVALEVYQSHSEVMDTRHCLTLIKKLGELVQKRPEDRTRVLQDNDFSALCNQLFIQCRRMEVEEWLQLLKYLSFLEVVGTSKITQAVLQMLKNQINDLSLKQLIFLEFLLKKLSLTPLSDALLTAIPILLSNAITTTPLDNLSYTNLSLAFTICSQGKVSGLGILLDEMYRRGSVRNVSLAMSLVWTLTRVSQPRLQRRLLTPKEQLTREVIMKECLETLARETDSLTHHQLESTLSKLCVGHEFGDRICYNERFLNAAASYVCRNSLPFINTAHTIIKMFKMNYVSEELIRYTVKLILSRPEDVPASKVGVLPLISAITATPLPQHDVKAALDVIMTHHSLQFNSDYYRKPLLPVAMDLLSVDYYHPQLMDILTSPDTLSMFMSKYSKDDNSQWKLVDVDQVLKVVLQSPNSVPETFLEPGRTLRANQLPTRSSLKAMLSQILPNPNNIMSGVVTEGGIYIDHLLVLDCEGAPIPIRNTEEDPLKRNPSMASLDLPPDATKIAILDIGSAGAFKPTLTLKGPQRIRQSVLEGTGFKVVPLLQAIIFEHHDEEKILYVKRELMEAGMTVD